MLYLYDRAVVENLEKSFNPEKVKNPVVKVIPPEQVIGVAAQIQSDRIHFPIVAVTRNDYQIDTQRTNFTRIHKGIASVIDQKTNNLYYEKTLPIELSYNLTVLATNQADMDELTRELLFKYSSMYFLTINLPYEADRKVRFGIELDESHEIERSSASGEYLSSGQLYQSIIRLRCEGCNLVTYTPAHLRRMNKEGVMEIE